MKRIRKPKADDPISARHIGDIVDRATRVDNVTFGRGFDVRNDSGGLHVQLRNDPQQEPWTLCKIVDEGPDGEADYTDERYWVREVYCQNAAGDTDSRMSFATFEAGGEPFYGTATNLAEIGLPAGNQHLLLNHYTTFPVVMVYSVWDNDDPPNAHHYFMGGGCPDVIAADGICYICSWFPDTNFGGQERSFAFLDTAGNEIRMLIHWPKMPERPEALILTHARQLIRWATGANGAIRLWLYEITEDFDPCAVTWNTEPTIGLFMGLLRVSEAPTTNGDELDIANADGGGLNVLTRWNWPYDGAYGIEIRMELIRNASSAWLVTTNASPLLLMPGVVRELECITTVTAPTTSHTTATTSTDTTSTTATTTSHTTSTVPTTPPTETSSTTSTETTTSTGTTTSHTTSTPGPTTTPPATTTTTAGPTTSSNPCVCCPDDTPDQMDVTISGMGGTFCAGQDNNTWRLDLITADSVLCQWQYNVGGRLINLICVYNLGIEEYVWVVQYSRGDCGCEWQTGSEDNQCDGGSITPPYAGSCLAGGGGGTASWTPVP